MKAFNTGRQPRLWAPLVALLLLVATAAVFDVSVTQDAAAEATTRCWGRAREQCVKIKRESCLNECGKFDECRDLRCKGDVTKCRSICNGSVKACEWKVDCIEPANRACGGFPAFMKPEKCG